MLDQPFANIKFDSLATVFPQWGVQTVRGFAHLESTNSWAIQHANQFMDEQLPLLVVCDSQTAGRGRLGRSWHADEGTLTFSILDSTARLKICREHVSRLALVAGLSVAEAIETCIPPHTARIKWPNDVLVAGKKVAGVLIENVPQTASVGPSRIVLGIGLNISTDFSGASEEIRSRAGSLMEISGRALTLGQVLTDVLLRYQENLTEISRSNEPSGLSCVTDFSFTETEESGGFSRVLESIRPRCVLTGQQVRLSHSGQQILGKCCGIDDDGGLLIATSGGVCSYRSGEIVRIESGGGGGSGGRR